MIRSLILILCTVIGTISAAAQSPLIDKSRPDRLIEIGVHVGDGASTITQNIASQISGVSEFNLTPGNRFVAGLTALMPIRRYLGIGTGIDFAVNNYYWNVTSRSVEQGTLMSLYADNRFYTIDIPVYMQLSLSLGTRVRWTTDLGFYISLAAGGHTDTRSYTSWTNSLGQSQVSDVSYHRKYFKDKDPVVFGIAGTDYGLHLATGIVVSKHYSLRAVFHAGVPDLARNYGVLDVRVRNLNVTFKAGYIF